MNDTKSKKWVEITKADNGFVVNFGLNQSIAKELDDAMEIAKLAFLEK